MVDWQLKVVRLEKGWRLDFDRAEVTQVALGYALRLVAEGRSGERAEITLATGFQARLSEGAAWIELDPQCDENDLGKLILALRHRPLVSCTVDSSRRLTIDFDHGVSIVAPPNADYEAWDLDTSVIKLVAIPGDDEVAVWHRTGAPTAQE